MLIDLGLADFYLPNQNYNVRVASRHYKAPELLLGNEFYDYGIDMWGLGCILAGLLLRREPLFRGKDNVDQLGKIVAVLGSKDLFKYVQKYSLRLSNDLNKVIRKYSVRNNPSGQRKAWLSLMATENVAAQKSGGSKDSVPNPVPSPEGMNLLDQLLVYDHETRLTAREAMMHPFFDDVRAIVTVEVQSRWIIEQSSRS
jgi:casein kinase II subunit alpha